MKEQSLIKTSSIQPKYYWFEKVLLNRVSQELIKLYPSQNQINLFELYQIKTNYLEPTPLINSINIFYENIAKQKSFDLKANFPGNKKNFYLEGLIENNNSTYLINQTVNKIKLQDLFFLYNSIKKISNHQKKDQVV